MVALNQIVADGANALVNIAIRQATTPVSSAAQTSFTTDPFSSVLSSTFLSSPIATGSPMSTMTGGATITSAAGSPSPSDTGNPNPNQNNNSPLLFFVALGFGVVFTNLWYARLSMS